MHAVALRDLYGNDVAEQLPDTEWLGDAGAHGWIALTANPQIWQVPLEKQTILDHDTRVFAYGSAQHVIDAQGLIFGRWLLSMRRRARRPEPCFWRLYPTRTIRDLR